MRLFPGKCLFVFADRQATENNNKKPQLQQQQRKKRKPNKNKLNKETAIT